ncbi:MAG: glutamine-hydrolyzing GMP synthase subunit GuaA [Candidatus Aminicenantes bacterium]|nr:glutamine-hydrolyzing GMP synthase subunit GuaA [Candidatus Aminicenantes bacterium]
MDHLELIEDKIDEITEAIGDGLAISALSGGVDSSVCSVLAHRAIGDRLKCVFIDDGLMREDEPLQVVEIFAGLGIDVEVIDAQDRFFESLAGKLDPEDKRKAFRDTFYSVFGEEVLKSEARFLVQGTIAADVIETKGGVKTQHNILEQIGIDPQKGFGFQVIEPIKELFKHEVRRVGAALGLPEILYERMPFPGPGLATRVIGEVTPDRVVRVRKATTIVEEAIAPFKPFQAFAVLLADKGTGIEEGKRRFGDIIIIRSVESRDAMTAEPSQLPWDVLLSCARRITEEVSSVVRVAYELTSKPPATIEYI